MGRLFKKIEASPTPDGMKLLFQSIERGLIKQADSGRDADVQTVLDLALTDEHLELKSYVDDGLQLAKALINCEAIKLPTDGRRIRLQKKDGDYSLAYDSGTLTVTLNSASTWEVRETRRGEKPIREAIITGLTITREQMTAHVDFSRWWTGGMDVVSDPVFVWGE